MTDERSAIELLRVGARLIERALEKLDMTEVPCPHCETGLFYNREHARVYEQLVELPKKLRNAANRVAGAIGADGKPIATSKGFEAATVIYKGEDL